jgi:hypothetical protein
MSVQPNIRRELIRSFRKSPHPLIDAVVAACDIPDINHQSIRSYPFERCFSPEERRAMEPMLGWEIGLVNPLSRHWTLLLDVATELDEERMWKWQLWRTEVRLDMFSPAWLAVCVTNEAVLTGIRSAFDHEPANLPILVTPDAQVLAVPRRPAPRPPTALFI